MPQAPLFKDFPLAERIVGLVDIFDAVVSCRGQKKPFSGEDTMCTNSIHQGKR